MSERSTGAGDGQIRVRVVMQSITSGLEEAINRVLREEQARGAEVVDVKVTSTPPAEGRSALGSSFGEHVALILLRGGRGD